MTTSLGMPALPPPSEPTWKQAWDAALFGEEGWLRRQPAVLRHPRGELVELVARHTPDEVVLLGAAGALAPDLAASLPGTSVRFDLPDGFGGLVLAVDWLSHVPAHVVQVAEDGYPVFVHVDPLSGRERLGGRLNETTVPQSIGRWLTEWWPVADHGPGARAEVGTGRDAAWRDVVRRLRGGRALAVDPGHEAEDRPRLGSLHSPAPQDVGSLVPDGQRDLAADVAWDAVAAAVGGRVVRDGSLSRVEVG
jgi:hypothetical protein